MEVETFARRQAHRCCCQLNDIVPNAIKRCNLILLVDIIVAPALPFEIGNPT